LSFEAMEQESEGNGFICTKCQRASLDLVDRSIAQVRSMAIYLRIYDGSTGLNPGGLHKRFGLATQRGCKLGKTLRNN
jgi:hypothetical protein